MMRRFEAIALWLEERSYLPLALAVSFVVLVRSPIKRSLWLDETITAWVISGSLYDAMERSINYQGMSPLYFLMQWTLAAVVGHSEFALRITSLIAVALSAMVLRTLAKDFLSEKAGGLAVLAYLCLDGTLKSAFMARPYGIALLFCTLSLLGITRWMRTGAIRYLVLNITSTAVVLYLQFVFLPFVALPLLVAAFSVWTERSDAVRKRFFRFLLSHLLLAVILVPAARQLSILVAKKEAIFFTAMPALQDLGRAILPPYLFIYLVSGLVMAALVNGLAFQRVGPQIAIFCLWAFLPPCVLYFYSHFSGVPTFVDRFYFWQLPGLALLSAAIIVHLDKPIARAAMALTFAFMVLLRESDRVWHTEDWRGAKSLIAEAGDPTAPVFLYSGLAESEQLEWLRDEDRRQYLGAPLRYYSLENAVIPLPSRFQDSEALRFRDELMQKVHSERVFLVALRIKKFGAEGVYFPDEELLASFVGLGYSAETLLGHGAVRVFSLSRQPSN